MRRGTTVRTICSVILASALLLSAAVPAQARMRWITQYGTESYDNTSDLAANRYGISQVGSTQGEFPDQHGAGGSFIQRLDTDGQLLWVHQFPSILTTVAVQGTATYAAGFTRCGPAACDRSSFILRYSASGDLEWGYEFGSPDFEVLTMASTPDAVFVAGDRDPPAGSGLQDSSDAVVARFSSDGEREWVTRFGSNYFDAILDIDVNDAGVVVAGNRGGAWPTPLQDAFVASLDVSGHLRWVRRLGGSGTQDAQAVVAGEAIYVAGRTAIPLEGQTGAGEDDAFLVRYELDGRRTWTRQFGTAAADGATAMALSGHGVAVAGSTRGAVANETAAGGVDGFVVNFDGQGRMRKTLQFGSVDDDFITGIAIVSKLIVGGDTYGELGTKVGPFYGSDAFVAAFGSGDV